MSILQLPVVIKENRNIYLHCRFGERERDRELIKYFHFSRKFKLSYDLQKIQLILSEFLDFSPL